MLGGHAMIFHGLERHTDDSDVWLDPGPDSAAWTEWLCAATAPLPASYFWDLANRRRVDSSEIPEIVEDFGVIRIGGLEEPLDVFRRPNSFKEEEFDLVWGHASTLPTEDVRVFATIDLLASKVDSEREKDFSDVAYLEATIRSEFAPILRACLPEEAHRLFSRYVDHETCRAALANPHPEVHALAVETLRELAAGHNPFAREMLSELGENVPG